MLPGTRFSYFDRGEVLSNFKIQDQDGIGSCYANALSAALKVSHKDHPDISYLHASLQGTARTYNRNGRKLFDRGKGEVFNEGAWVCDAFDGLKEGGGACPGIASGLENNLHQKSLLKSLASFIDYQYSRNTNRADLNLKLRRLFEDAVNIRRKMKQDCVDQKELGFAPTEIIDRNLRSFLFTPNRSRCEKTLKAAIKKMYSDKTSLSPDFMDAEFQPTFIKKIRSIFSSSIAVKSLSKFHEMHEKQFFSRSEDVINPVFDELEKYIKAGLSDVSCRKEFIFPQRERFQFFEEIYHQHLKSVLADCEVLDESLVFERITHSSKLEDFYCLPPELQVPSQEIISHLSLLNSFIGDQFLERLINPGNLNSFDQLMDMLMPRCRRKENLISLNTLRCSEEHFSGDDAHVRMKRYQQKILTALKEKRGVAISVCSTFLNTTVFTPTNFCRTNPNPTDEHKSHAMSVTGYRCKDGKIQYQLLNSWGKTCPPGANRNYRNDYMECELDNWGRPSGKLWVDENVLFDSTLRVSVIST